MYLLTGTYRETMNKGATGNILFIIVAAIFLFGIVIPASIHYYMK